MKSFIQKVKCLFLGHWVSAVGLYIYDHKTGYTTELPGCLRCKKVFDTVLGEPKKGASE